MLEETMWFVISILSFAQNNQDKDMKIVSNNRNVARKHLDYIRQMQLDPSWIKVDAIDKGRLESWELL